MPLDLQRPIRIHSWRFSIFFLLTFCNKGGFHWRILKHLSAPELFLCHSAFYKHSDFGNLIPNFSHFWHRDKCSLPHFYKSFQTFPLFGTGANVPCPIFMVWQSKIHSLSHHCCAHNCLGTNNTSFTLSKSIFMASQVLAIRLNINIFFNGFASFYH